MIHIVNIHMIIVGRLEGRAAGGYNPSLPIRTPLTFYILIGKKLYIDLFNYKMHKKEL